MKRTDGYKIFTTIHVDRYEVGQIIMDTRNSRRVKVVRIDDRYEDGRIVYDVYVIAHNGQERTV